ncbi:MAG: hypothetical protein WCJ07_08555, partial [Verrucomicrobiota bacterium]
VGWDPIKTHYANWWISKTNRWATGDVRVAMERRGVTDPLTAVRNSLPLTARLLKVQPAKGRDNTMHLATAHYNEQLKKLENENFPALVENQFGAGKVFYFPADLTWAYYRLGDQYLASLLEQAVREAARQPLPVEVSAPRIVQATPFIQGNRLVVHLLNDISSLGRSQNVKGESLRERVEVIPIHDIKVTFREPRWRRFTLVPGGTELKGETTPQGKVVTVPPLKIHAMVVAEE